jgi:hypothetical protein
MLLTAALLGTLIFRAGAQDTDENKPSANKRSSTFGRMFTWGEEPTDKVVEVAAGAVPIAPTPAERIAREQERLKKAFGRRVQVCLRLREIAVETDDQELGQRADELEARAWSIYCQQAAKLGLPMMGEELGAPEGPGSGKPFSRGDGPRSDREGGR